MRIAVEREVPKWCLSLLAPLALGYALLLALGGISPVSQESDPDGLIRLFYALALSSNLLLLLIVTFSLALRKPPSWRPVCFTLAYPVIILALCFVPFGGIMYLCLMLLPVLVLGGWLVVLPFRRRSA